MRKSIAIAITMAVGIGATAAGASTVPNPWYGSDVLQVVTDDVIADAPFTADNPPAVTGGPYLAGGSGTGQSAMAQATGSNAKQVTAPMTKMLTSGACTYNGGTAAAPTTTNSNGVVIGMDAVDVFASATVDSACNTGSGGGLASNVGGFYGVGGTNPPHNWKAVLALIYGGLDITTGVVDCNQTSRHNLVANWGNLFENGCANPNTVCLATGGVNGTGDGIHAGQLIHAFRQDDSSGTVDVFSSVLGLQQVMPSPSASSNGGFGASPYCNALNWDTSSVNVVSGNCKASADDQFVGPGGILDPASQCTFASFGSNKALVASLSGSGSTITVTTTLPHQFLTGLQVTISGDTLTAANAGPTTGAGITVTGPTTFTFASTVTGSGTGGTAAITNDSNAGCGTKSNGVTGVPGAGNHRSPPVGTLGYNGTDTSVIAWDVLPTSFQDNDPIRTPCVGNGSLGNSVNPEEEVCNLDGKLGLVLTIPASDFIPSLGFTQYPVNNCNGWQVGAATEYANCAPGTSGATHAGECPNGDSAGTGGCYVPVDTINGTSQCINSSTQNAPSSTRTLGSYDGRTHNLHMYTPAGSTGTPAPAYITQVQQNGTANGVSIAFAGGMGRIHAVSTIFNKGAGTPPNIGCQLVNVTNQIACLAQADPCSIAVTGDGGKTWTNELIGQVYTKGTPSSVPGTFTPICTFLTAKGDAAPAACTPFSTSGTLVTDSMEIDGVYPTSTTVTELGQQASEYQLSRKLYFNSIIGFAAIKASLTSTSQDGPSDVATGEVDFASYESTASDINPLLTAVGYFPLANQSLSQLIPAAQASLTTNATNAGGAFASATTNASAFNQPFCEDFNEGIVCGATAGNAQNACHNNVGLTGAFGTIPSDPSSVPTADVVSTVCGNGIQEYYEECDNGTANGAVGNTCSNTCRCANGTSYENTGSGGWFCQ